MIQDIQNQLNDIQNFVARIQTLQQLSNIEKDILLEKIRSLYDIVLLSDTNASTPVSATIPEPVRAEETPSPEPLIELEITHTEPSTIGEEIANSAMEVEVIKEDIVVQEPVVIETMPEEVIEVATQPTEAQASVQQVASPSKSDVGTKLAKKPITNISSAIGINERFQFIKELFKNDVTLYNGTIATLNALDNFDTAMKHISTNFDWDMEQTTVQRFVSIVERRYL